MKFIVGLGNPGTKYQNNRHNVGFMFVDYLVDELASLRNVITLFKPQTFMNNSGVEVKKYVLHSTFHVQQDLIVVHDDLDIPLGKFKIHLGTGPQLHNGITSIEQHLGSNDFWRVRIGIDNRLARRSSKSEGGIDGETRYRMVPGETYILKNFTGDERKTVNKVFPMILQRLKEMKMI